MGLQTPLAEANADSGGNATSLTFGLTIPAGHSNVALYIRFGFRAGSVPAASSVTYNGVAATSVRERTQGVTRAAVYRLYNPTADGASHNVVVTAAASCRIVADAIALEEVDPSTPEDGLTDGGSSSATSASLSVTSRTGDLVLDVIARDQGTPALVVGSGQTQDFNRATGSGSSDEIGAGSRENGAATVAMDWQTWIGNRVYSQVGINVRKAPVTVSLAGSATLTFGATATLSAFKKLQAAAALSFGATAALSISTNAPAPFVVRRDSRWILKLAGGSYPVRISDRPGEINGRAWKAGIIDVTPEVSTLDLSTMTMTLRAASVTLPWTVARFFDPRRELAGLQAWLWFYHGGTARTYEVLKARVVEPEIGNDGDPIVLRLVEDLDGDPLFPPAVVESPAGLAVIADGADGTAYTWAFGKATHLPMKHIGPDPIDGSGSIWMITGHALAADPCSISNLPNKSYPDIGSIADNTVARLLYGKSFLVRDNWDTATLSLGWEVSGTVTPNTTVGGVVGVTFGAPANVLGHSIFWAPWTFSERISEAFLGQFVDAAARIRVFYGDQAAAPAGTNRTRITIDSAAGSVTVDVIANGTTIRTKTETGLTIPTTETLYTFEIREGSLEVGIGDKKISFGDLGGPVTGRIGFGCINGRTFLRRLQMPATAEASAPATAAPGDMNLGIRSFSDLKGRTFTAQKLTGDIDGDLFAVLNKAQGIFDAGALLRRLVGYTGYSLDRIDDPRLEEAVARLGKYVVGGYFEEQQKLTSEILRGRLAQEFGILIAQEFGALRFAVVDPLAGSERHFRLGVKGELLDRLGPRRGLPEFTHYAARFRFSAMTKEWKTTVLNPSNTPALSGALGRSDGIRKDAPVLELRDVGDEHSARMILVGRASLTNNASEIPYLQDAPHWQNDQGRLVTITDEAEGLEDAPAILVQKQLLSPDYVSMTYRIFEPLVT